MFDKQILKKIMIYDRTANSACLYDNKLKSSANLIKFL